MTIRMPLDKFPARRHVELQQRAPNRLDVIESRQADTIGLWIRRRKAQEEIKPAIKVEAGEFEQATQAFCLALQVASGAASMSCLTRLVTALC